MAPSIAPQTVEEVLRAERAERAALASERRLRLLADSMPHLVWVARADGVVEYYNARAELYGGVERTADGAWRWQPIVHEDDLPRTLEAWQEAVEARRPYACEHRIRMADGSFRWHLSRANVAIDADGRDTWYGTATDIHEHKRTALALAEREAELAGAVEASKRAITERDQIVSLVSHDLRNPLGGVKLQTSILRRDFALGRELTRERLESALTRIERHTAKMERLLNELLDVSRLRAGEALELSLVELDLGALASRLVEEHQRSTSRHRISLQVVGSVVGRWDAGRMEQVIDNLLSNALKYSPEGGDVSVTVGCDPTDDWAVLRVKDPGVGIAAGDRGRIFDWFTRGANAPSIVRGTGIGLAGARKIVEQHGGSISVESEEGQGALFTVRLPKSREASPS